MAKAIKPNFNGNPLIFIAIFLISALVLNSISSVQNNIAYSEFKNMVKKGEVDKVLMAGEEISIFPKGTSAVTSPSLFFSNSSNVKKTIIPVIGDDSLIPLLESNNVKIESSSSSPGLFTSLIVNLLPWVLIFGFFFWSSKKISKGIGQFNPQNIFGKGKERRYDPNENPITYDDVAGLENAKQDLQEIVSFLKDPSKFHDIGASLPKGVLLQGPPGTGKTLLAKATAGEAGVPFFSIGGSEFIELYVGMGASRVRQLFESARKEAPSIIFIDEIDSIGRSRGTGLGGGHDEREQTLNQILASMDGFETTEPVVVMAATNRPDVLDSALTRPGRFDRQITLDLPKQSARMAILKVHTKKVPLDENDVKLEKIAQSTVGFSGADLKNLVNEAALFAARDSRKKVSSKDFDNARDKIILGHPRSEMLKDKDKEVISVHESGHALVALLTPEADPVRKVTIIPRGRALGFTEQVSEDDKVNVSKTYLESQLAILLGGRIAEKIIFSEITTGAEDDLKRATKLASKMVSNWGMSEEFGLTAYRKGGEHHFLGKELTENRDFSETTATKIDQAVERIIKEREEYVTKLLNNNKDKLLLLSAELLKREEIIDSEIQKLIFNKDPESENISH